jgi:hypothetical protein
MPTFYKYYLKIGAEPEFECFPTNELTFSWADVSEEEYKEKKISEITFDCKPNDAAPQLTDYDSIIYADPCTEIEFIIRSYMSNFEQDFANFIFTKNKAKVNTFEKTISINPKNDDDYQKLKDLSNDDVNLLGSGLTPVNYLFTATLVLDLSIEPLTGASVPVGYKKVHSSTYFDVYAR